jgi:hypothetical protein
VPPSGTTAGKQPDADGAFRGDRQLPASSGAELGHHLLDGHTIPAHRPTARRRGAGLTPAVTDTELICLAIARVLLRYYDERHGPRAARTRVGHLSPRLLRAAAPGYCRTAATGAAPFPSGLRSERCGPQRSLRSPGNHARLPGRERAVVRQISELVEVETVAVG